MILSFSFEDRTFDDLDDLLRFINEHARSEDYAMILLRIKKFKLNVKCKAWIICDRERKSHECTKQNRRHDDSRHIECSFFIVVKLADENADSWIYEMKNSKHNHAFIIVDNHSALRRLTMTREIRNEIFKQMIVQITFHEILFSLRLSHAANPHSSDAANSDSANSDPSNSDSANFDLMNFDLMNFDLNLMIRSRDIYNMKAQLRRDELDFMTSIQVLMHQLTDDDWFYAFQKDRRNQINHFFFSKKSSQFILKANYEVLVMNCIYKTNKYKMSLFIISDQIALHKNFYVVFCFMTKEKQNDYVWVLQQLKRLYAKLKISDSTVLIIDMKKNLMNVCRLIFSVSNHLLCLWHINNNVLINCKKHFIIKEVWDKFFSEWKEMMYASSEREYRDLWDKFVNRYNLSHSDCINYLYDIYILSYRRRFIKCYINQMLHFDITITSRDEDAHAILKRQLDKFTNDLKTIMNEINLLLINELQNYRIDLNDDRMRYFMKCRKPIFDQIAFFVSINVLRKILSQYKLLMKRSIVMSVCINVLIIIIELLCSHRIQKRMFQKESILIEDVHSHWR